MSLSYIILLIASGNTTKILKNEIKFQGNVIPSNVNIYNLFKIHILVFKNMFVQITLLYFPVKVNDTVYLTF